MENNLTGIQKLLRIKQLELDALLEITKAINQNATDEDLYKIFAFTVLAQLQVRSLALLVKEKHWKCKYSFSLRLGFKNKKEISSVFSFCEPTFIIIKKNKFLNQFNYVIPISDNKKKLAFILIGGLSKTYLQLHKKMLFILTLSKIVFVAIENKKLLLEQVRQNEIEKEIRLAAQVQSLLFPKSLPAKGNVHVFAKYTPHKNIGGDYYDFVQTDSTHFYFCIADVTGKGVSAALLMANFQANFRALARQQLPLRELIRQLNRVIFENANGEKYVTFFVAHYNPASQNLQYINAGHNYPLLYTKTKVIELDSQMPPLGIFNQYQIPVPRNIPIKPGNLLFLYTDGLIENNVSGNFTDTKHLKEFIISNKSCEGNLFLNKIIQEFSFKKPTDDCTVMLVRFC